MAGRNTTPDSSKLPRSPANVVRAGIPQIGATRGSNALAPVIPSGVSSSGATSSGSPREQGRQIALLAAAAGRDKKAEDIQIIDVVGKVDYADYLVLMTGASDRNVAAIARGVEEELERQHVRALALEGLPLARWVLIDFVDVVVHVFQAEWRGIYDLDGLWMDAARLALPAPVEHV